MSFNVALKYIPANPEDPAGEFIPQASEYELQVDGIEFIEPGACSANETLCGVGCVDYLTDTEHCGGCNQPCDETRVCSGGQCACPAGFEECDGTCRNLQEDADNCGACGNSCTGPCAGGSCGASTCGTGMGKATETCTSGEMMR